MTPTEFAPSRAWIWFRRALVLLAVAALAVPVIIGPKEVAVRINGVASTVTTTAETVGELLHDEGVELAAGDIILPAPTTPIDAAPSVTVIKPIEVTVVVNGEPRDVRTTRHSVAGALSAAGLGASPGAEVQPPRTSLLEEGGVVEVVTPNVATIIVDGSLHPIVTTAETVGEAIEGAGIELGDDDVIRPRPGAPMEDGAIVVVNRVDEREEIEEVLLPHPTERRATSALYRGTERVVDAGSDGLRHDVYRVRYVDGEEVERELVDEEIVREPTPRIVEYGTKPPPPPPSADDDSIWYRLAQCESGGRWDYNGTYDGGLQFHPDTWRRFKPAGYPEYAYQASPEQQIEVGKRVQRAYGWDAWPSCARKLGLT